MQLAPVMMNFRYGSAFGRAVPEAYETLLLDAMLGDPTLFARHDFVEASWALITPIHEAWAASGAKDIATYEAGEWGPAEADAMLAADRPSLEDAVTTTARALTGTVVVVGAAERLQPVADALAKVGESIGLRSILISEGEQAAPPAKVDGNTTFIAGLAPRFLNNAVAALRLSSLPTLVWWRGGSIEALNDLAHLADRLVLDVEAPEDAWRQAGTLFERTALTDIALDAADTMAIGAGPLFDLPQVHEAADAFQQLTIEAADVDAARLFAGWFRSRLRWTPAVSISITPAVESSGPSPLSNVAARGDELSGLPWK